ncbi:MAG: transposon-encoded TnpW family protein [Oscillospiraceae bacterium]|nr:transposon-encoded TnpW family protein [Oscillospiraceae bacterium]
MTTTTTAPDKGASAATTVSREREPLMLQKRIGSTMFTVNVRFSDTGAETLEDKIFRLIEREVEKIA